MCARIWIYKAFSRPLYGNCLFEPQGVLTTNVGMKAVREVLRLLVQSPFTLMWGPWVYWVEFSGLSGSCCCVSLSLTCFVFGYKQLLNLKYCTLCSFVTCHLIWWIKNCTWPFYGICGKQRKGNDWSCGGNTTRLLCIHHSHPEVSHSHPTPLISMQQTFSVFLELKFSV
jgi:hypothetical protein